MSGLEKARLREIYESGVKKKKKKNHPSPHNGDAEKISMQGRSEGHLWEINVI